ncbi:hypothetical protein [Endozoicomonas sp. 2B-B]
MGFNLGSSKSKNKSQQSSESNPLTPDEVKGYYDMLNGITDGRMDTFATQGTPTVNYQALTPEQLAGIGGAGETRRNALNTSLKEQKSQINNDSSLTVAQRSRANQTATDSYNGSMDAINKEVESLMTALASQENQSSYNAAVRNANLTREDLSTIANIFFGGKGQKSKSEGSSKGSSSSWGFGAQIA